MPGVRNRLELLKKEKNIKTDSDLLREIFPLLQSEGKTKFDDVETFVAKTKGSFSQMVDEKNQRRFDQDFYLPLEEILDTSMAYLLKGKNAPIIDKDNRGLRYTARTDTIGNYEKLIAEGILFEFDEYQWTLLDYMIDFKSKNGFEFFANRNELPISDTGIAIPHHINAIPVNKKSWDSAVISLIELCSPKIVLKYFDGYYYPNNGTDISLVSNNDKFSMKKNAGYLLKRKDIWPLLCDYKVISLKKQNPALSNKNGEPLQETAFVNLFLNMMLEYAFFEAGPYDLEENVQIELLEKAMKVNEEIMPVILALPYDGYRFGEYGYIYSSDIICGSIARLNVDLSLLSRFSPNVQENVIRLQEQIRLFFEKLTKKSEIAILGREMRLSKKGSADFYDFYRLMNGAECEYVAKLKEESSEKDLIILPEGERKTLSLDTKGKTNEANQAFSILSKLDEISSSALGEEKTYVLPELDGRFFYLLDGEITGIAPTQVGVGNRYDNFAELLSFTYLVIPYIVAANDQVKAVIGALRSYGVKKKDLKKVLESLESYYEGCKDRYDASTERGKVLISNTLNRMLWISLFAEEIIEKFDK